MSAVWLWIPGAYGSTQNDGWLEVFDFSLRLEKMADFSVRPDSAEVSIFSKCARGDVVYEIILFIEPQKVYRFYQSVITSVSSSDAISVHFRSESAMIDSRPSTQAILEIPNRVRPCF
jgi:hypothetical protein